MPSLDYINSTAEIAIYDNLQSLPRIVKVGPNSINEYIENLASSTYKYAAELGGKLPYTTIREVAENFIHANFSEIVISILDSGNTIRFADQGPGFNDIENAKLPGFTSATQQMKKYIRGVGSGLPTVNDYLTISNGILQIQNNLNGGAVITISILNKNTKSEAFLQEKSSSTNIQINRDLYKLLSTITDKEIQILKYLYKEGPKGNKEIHESLNIPQSSVHKLFTNLQNKGLLELLPNKKRILSDKGHNFIQNLF